MRLDIDKIELQSGAHPTVKDGLCVMEAVAYIAREQHSDHPVCVSPVITAFLRSWNDALSTDDRQKLKPLIPVVMDTASTPEDEDRRSWMCLDWLVRTYTPAWLRLAGLTIHADTLLALPEIKTIKETRSLRPALDAAGDAAWAAARAAAGDAGWDAAGDAAGDAGWDAAGDAAQAAGWDAAGDAAGDAAQAAAGDAAGDAAQAAGWDAAGWDAARDAAWDAARDAARAAAGDAARAAARDAARDALRPTVVDLQASAIALVERMVWLKDD